MTESAAAPAPPNHTMNSSFKPGTKLQLAWDSTSLGALKTCPRLYEYTIIEGWTPRALSVHLAFGLYYHAALEAYDHAKFGGADHEQATLAAVRKALSDSWHGNRPWNSDDKNKNRFTLIRTVVWYLEQFREDPAETVRLANGKPAVELSFRYETTYTTASGEPFLYCGHIDRLAKLGETIYVFDRKTTAHTIGQDFFRGFSPDNQFSGYALAGKLVYGLPVNGVIIDGAQVAVTFSRFLRGPSPRTEAQLDEWYTDLGYWLKLAQFYAANDHWPMNDKACGNYGGCAFRDICAKPAVVRAQWLQATYKKRTWDPLVVRGDV